MEDPLTIPGPLPSYALESDSEDEDDYDGPNPVSKGEALGADKEARVTLEGKVETGRKCVFLVGEAGEWVAAAAAAGSGLGRGKVVGKVLLDGEQVASVEESSTATIIYLTTSIPLVSLHPVSSTLLTALKPLKTTIISSYHLPSYIPPSSSTHEGTGTSSTILYLSSSPGLLRTSYESLQPFTPPNLLHGLPSSLFTLSSLASLAPTLLLLLPTLSLNPPLNPPFPLTSPSQYSNTSYDAGGPTDLSEFGGVYKGVLGGLSAIGREEGWWVADEGKKVVAKGGKGGGDGGFEWLEAIRKTKRRELVGSMYM